MSHWKQNAQAILDADIEIPPGDLADIQYTAKTGYEPYYTVKAIIHRLYEEVKRDQEKSDQD